jgi:hypothetical protein
MFDPSMLRVYDIRPFSLRVYILCDPARSKKKGSDNTAYAVIGVDSNLNKYLLDGINQRCDLKERWDYLLMLYKKWKAAPGIQSVEVGYEKYGALADLDYFKEQMQRINFNFPIKELAWPSEGGGSKSDRVQRLVPELKSGRFFIAYPTDKEKLTSNQRRHQAEPWLWSTRIRRKDSEGVIYDLTTTFRNQVTYFPMGKVDLIDAVARIFDMGITRPNLSSEQSFEPDWNG